jgi:hypothetical protein
MKFQYYWICLTTINTRMHEQILPDKLVGCFSQPFAAPGHVLLVNILMSLIPPFCMLMLALSTNHMALIPGFIAPIEGIIFFPLFTGCALFHGYSS